MTTILATLEHAGMVVREGDPADGRRARVTATDAGRRTLERMRRRKAAYLARRLRELSDEDVRTLDGAVAILERLLEAGR
jgi:DNA-binding MarR family transcriptional regulator